MSTLPVPPIGGVPVLDGLAALQNQPVVAQQTGPVSFAQMLTNGIDRIDQKVATADAMVRAFALDDSVPVHQVTYALQQAQESVELAMQVRNRLIQGYQQLMNMQL